MIRERCAVLEEAEWGDPRLTLGLEEAEWGDHLDVLREAFLAAYQEEFHLDDLAAVQDVASAAD